MDEFLTTVEVAKILGVTPYTVRRYIKIGKLPYCQFSERGQLHIPRRGIEYLLTLKQNGKELETNE